MRARLLQTLLVCSPFLACGDALAPSDFTGYYRLRAVNEGQLPGVVEALPTSCTATFSGGSLFLADGAFSVSLVMSEACPGVYGTVGPREFGGALSVEGTSLRLRAIDPTSPDGSTFDATVRIDGADAVIELPKGALMGATATTLRFGPRKPDFLTP